MISPNSISSYHNHVKGKLDVTQNQKVLSFMLMHNVPMSNRMLHQAMEGLIEIEFGDLKRTTHTLCKKGFIEVAFNKPCEIRQQKPVKYYVIKPVQLNIFK